MLGDLGANCDLVMREVQVGAERCGHGRTEQLAHTTADGRWELLAQPKRSLPHPRGKAAQNYTINSIKSKYI